MLNVDPVFRWWHHAKAGCTVYISEILMFPSSRTTFTWSHYIQTESMYKIVFWDVTLSSSEHRLSTAVTSHKTEIVILTIVKMLNRRIHITQNVNLIKFHNFCVNQIFVP
jgi:hypothetical protein